MFVCFCTCEYVQFVGSRQNKKCVLWYKLEGCIYIDWRICVFNVHLPLELSFFLWSIPFYTQTFWTERFEISFDICRPCVWYEWLRVCVLYARPFVDLIYSNFCLGDMVTDSTSVKWYCLRISRKSPNWTSFNVYSSYWNTITYINLICTWYRMSDLKNFALMFSIRIVHTYIYKVQGTLYVNSPCYFA